MSADLSSNIHYCWVPHRSGGHAPAPGGGNPGPRQDTCSPHDDRAGPIARPWDGPPSPPPPPSPRQDHPGTGQDPGLRAPTHYPGPGQGHGFDPDSHRPGPGQDHGLRTPAHHPSPGQGHGSGHGDRAHPAARQDPGRHAATHQPASGQGDRASHIARQASGGDLPAPQDHPGAPVIVLVLVCPQAPDPFSEASWPRDQATRSRPGRCARASPGRSQGARLLHPP